MKNWQYILIFSGLSASLLSCDPDMPTPSPPSPTPVDNVDTVLRNVSYGADALQKMDIYLPEGRNSLTPVIMLIHGGAWAAGDKSEMEIIIPKIQAEWPEAAIVNINYRLANGASVIHTQITEDLQSAVNHVVTQSSEYSTGTDLAMIGASAGAHLALLYSYKHNEGHHVKAVSNVFGIPLFADWEYYSSFNPLLGGNLSEVYKKYAGVYWNTELYQSLSPYNLVTAANYVPTISFHGSADVIVPVYQNQWFKAKLNELSLDSEYYEYAGEGHGFSDAKYTDCIRKTISFFKENM